MHWDQALVEAGERWNADVRSGALRPTTRARYQQILGSFSGYAHALGVASPCAVTIDDCRRFLFAPLRGSRATSTATARLRLTVLLSAFEGWTLGGRIGSNPAAGLRVPHDAVDFAPRPLTPPEATRLLLAGRTSPSDTLRPATVALALCGGTHGEIAGATIADLDLEDCWIQLGAAAQRRCALPRGAARALEVRVADRQRLWRRGRVNGEFTDLPLALNRSVSTYPINSVAPTVSGNLARALRRAGIVRPGVRPKSVRECAANALYAELGSIEAVAESLGVDSLDATARLIDRPWQARWGDHVRAAGGV